MTLHEAIRARQPQFNRKGDPIIPQTSAQLRRPSKPSRSASWTHKLIHMRISITSMALSEVIQQQDSTPQFILKTPHLVHELLITKELKLGHFVSGQLLRWRGIALRTAGRHFEVGKHPFTGRWTELCREIPSGREFSLGITKRPQVDLE